METEPKYSGEAKTNSEPQMERGKEMFLEKLRDEIWQAAQEMGVNLTSEELRVAWAGPKTEEENWVPFKLSDRAAGCSLRAKDASENTLERRVSGAHSLVLKAASYLRGAPDLAAELLQYARDVWEGKYIWHEQDVPQITPEPVPGIETEEKKKAA